MSHLRTTAVALAGMVMAVGILVSPPVSAGPEPEPSPSAFDFAYPGWFTAAPRQTRKTVARVRFENTGGSTSAGLDVCVALAPGFHDAAVDGSRRRVRVTRGGQKICWFAGATPPGARRAAVVRATVPRLPGRYVTRVELIAVQDTYRVGEKLTRSGTVMVKR